MHTNLSALSIVHRCLRDCRACATYLARHGDQPHTQPASQLQPHTKHLSQLLITLAWIIISINNNRVLQVELCWNGAHIIPYFKFQLSPSAERAARAPTQRSTTLFRSLSLLFCLSLVATLRLPIAALRFFAWKQAWGGRGEPCWSFTFRIWLLTFGKYI